MGFFSSRKATEPLSSTRSPGKSSSIGGSPSVSSAPLAGPSTSTSQEKSVAQVIRSKIYGKGGRKSRSDVQKQDKRLPYVPSVSSIAESAAEGSKSVDIQHNLLQPPEPQRSRPNLPLRTPRSSSDATSMSLAQRLDELAAANAEGLLDDDEYRLLRQNLFERFSSASQLPSEAPVVPLLRHPESRRTSDYTDGHSRTASIKSQSSFGSTISGLMRKATRRDQASSSGRSPLGDSASIASLKSQSSSIRLPNLLPRRQASSNSLSSQRSRIAPDAKSIASTRSIRSAASRGTRPFNPPPSSFSSPRRVAHWPPDDERLQSAAEIRAEIAETEAESQRLLDAFDGLEQSAFQRHRYDPSPSSSSPIDNTDSTWTIIPEQSSKFSDFRGLQKINTNFLLDAGSPSFRHQSPRKQNRSEYLSVLQISTPGHPSPSDDGKSPSDYSNLVASTMQSEVNDIRRRRMEVTDRYQQRLDYLKARLKGAEIHERLMRK